MKKFIIPIIIGSTILLSTQLISCTNKTETNQTSTNSEIESNKKVVLDFYQQMFGDKDLTAVDKYIATEYIQHNPEVADGAAAFKKAAESWFKGAPKTKIDVQHIAAEGDLVFLHVKDINPDGSLKSVIDIFRLKDGKIVEHWDVQQDVPKEAANEHPMF
ncbi:ester cyclase [Empedobacter brevis]|uniref:nuclear transport factor 2 family protein n=1 Tax=Empedobacter brevis TaxID=247 RepID=UPI0039B02E57